MIEVREWEDLTPHQREGAALLDASDNDPVWIVDRLMDNPVGGGRLRDYLPLFAVEGGDVLARVSTIRSNFRTRHASGRFCGVADVVTRPDALRRGLAGRLLEEHHRRARAEGIRWSFLWTHRSWGAHRFYEGRGYRDVYAPPVLLRRVPRSVRPLAPRYSVRRSTSRDAGALDSLFERATRGRTGFVPRRPGSFAARFRLGRRPARGVRQLLHDRRAVGYAIVDESPDQLTCVEAVGLGASHRPALLDLLERAAAGRWLAVMRTTFATDVAVEAGRRGYARLDALHSTLMAKPLAGSRPNEWAEFLHGFRDPEFSCHTGDMF